ncbi:MAG: hypothetical protein IIA62_10185, partial [Nitrospinae bacterium]|nr:hypothetical protein [Nitrospinota bacterium]
PMYIETVPNRKSRPAILLREGWREGKKVKKRTLANLTDWPQRKIDALRMALSGEQLMVLDKALTKQNTRSHGHVDAVLKVVKKLGLDKVIAAKPCREREIIVATIVARICSPDSKLAMTRWWKDTTLPELLNIDGVDEDDIYEAMDWLLERPCDILIPAARPDAITSRNVDRIHCRIVCQGANSPSSKTTEFYLQKRRGIVSLNDFIVNVGGVMGCAVELKMTIDKVYKARIIAEGNNGRSYIEGLVYNTVSNNVEIILRLMREKKESDLIFREHALQIALERLDNSTESWL